MCYNKFFTKGAYSMKLKQLSIFEFDAYATSHPLTSFYQTSAYGMLMAEEGYDYDLMGLVDDEGNLQAASLILKKKIAMNAYYGYAPRGFLMDYTNESIVKEFASALRNYYARKGYAFIKINPEIATASLNEEKTDWVQNQNIQITQILEQNGYQKLKNNLYFESMLPRYNAIVPLKEYALEHTTKRCRNKIHKSMRKGVSLYKGEKSDLPTLFHFIEHKKTENELHLKHLYNILEKQNNIDLYFVKIDFEDFLVSAKKLYEEELENNIKCNERLTRANNETNLNRKMESDRTLLSYKNDIMIATKGLAEQQSEMIAGALIVKFQNRILIYTNGYNPKYKSIMPNYFLFHAILEHYKEEGFAFADLNGIAGDLTNANPFAGLNEFKLGFTTKAFEYIGEFDFILNENLYRSLAKSGYLAKEFNKK